MTDIGTPSSSKNDEMTVSKTKQPTFFSDLKALVKIGIVNSNLITVFTGFWLALHFTNSSFMAHWDLFLLTMFGSSFVIMGGSILNNWYDVDIDPVMTRTKIRPTVTGKITLRTAFILGTSFSLIGHILLMFTTLAATFVAFIGWFTYVILYTVWSKRRYTLNTAVGSISGAVPPLIGWTAVEPNLHIIPVALFVIMFIWQTPHFLSLAMRRCKEYKKAGIPMLPAVYGFEMTKRQIVIYITCLLPVPFFMVSLGTTFLVIATILNVIWLALGISGFFVKNDLKWANVIFVYSLNYLTIMFILMIVTTIELPI
ncbi:MAG TPA: heme o synthase [Bacillota bacterium]